MNNKELIELLTQCGDSEITINGNKITSDMFKRNHTGVNINTLITLKCRVVINDGEFEDLDNVDNDVIEESIEQGTLQTKEFDAPKGHKLEYCKSVLFDENWDSDIDYKLQVFNKITQSWD